MSQFTRFEALPDTPGNDTLRITSKKISAEITALRFIDKDTKQHIIYLPALDMTGYGETQQKAHFMIREALEDYFTFLSSMSMDKMVIELAKFGWHRNKLFRKHFSKAFVDDKGQLQNLNAVDDKVEKVQLVAA